MEFIENILPFVLPYLTVKHVVLLLAVLFGWYGRGVYKEIKKLADVPSQIEKILARLEQRDEEYTEKLEHIEHEAKRHKVLYIHLPVRGSMHPDN